MHNILPAAAAAALAFEERVLPNGLCLRLHPMPGYSATHVIYATAFGSINCDFEKNGARTSLPAGVAHFLEHKMFESEDGVDAFSLYAETGAAANAYTSFDRTSYIFTATREIDRNLDILLGLVGHPHFTEATVQKEQGIIAQEIGMYRDSPEMRCFFGILECLYHNHPVRQDIAGSVESIAQITPQLLYNCTAAFYVPANMALCAAGNVNMEQLLAAVERAGLPTENAGTATRLFAAEPPAVFEKERRFSMPVAMPLFAVGFKEPPVPGNTLKTEIICDFLGELLFGETSPLYRRLYDEGLIQPDFSCEFGCYQGCLHLIVSGESEQPEAVRDAIFAEIARVRREGIDAEQFSTCKKMMYGESIAELENVERVASQLASSFFRRRTPAQELAAVTATTLDDVQDALQNMMQQERSSFLVIEPQA